TSLCYIPDHEPGLGAPLAELDEEWISGYDLARDAAMLLHDAQYTDDEYPRHIGWGHSPISDALSFADRTRVARLMLFHHDALLARERLLRDPVGGRQAGRRRRAPAHAGDRARELSALPPGPHLPCRPGRWQPRTREGTEPGGRFPRRRRCRRHVHAVARVD